MAKYKVWGSFTASVSITVEADSKDEAFDKAHEEFNGIKAYAGNGGYDKLIGVSGSNETIEAEGAEIIWELPFLLEAQEVKE